MRDYRLELETRVANIRALLQASGAEGLIYGNSGGKDSVLVGILCQKACENTLGVLMPCASKRNFGEDLEDGLAVARAFGIRSLTVDLTPLRNAFLETLEEKNISPNQLAQTNLPPRLRMNTLYAIANTRNLLVAGTSNRSEIYVGYFTKWGDGAYDFNPISDLTVREVYEFLRYLGVSEHILTKPPSGGLFDGQTDEQDLGISYDKIDDYLLYGKASGEDRALIERLHERTKHKRK